MEQKLKKEYEKNYIPGDAPDLKPSPAPSIEECINELGGVSNIIDFRKMLNIEVKNRHPDKPNDPTKKYSAEQFRRIQACRKAYYADTDENNKLLSSVFNRNMTITKWSEPNRSQIVL